MAICVAVVTYSCWVVLYALGAAGFGLATVFSRNHHEPPAMTFGAVWQWVVGSTAFGLIGTLLGAPRYSRMAAIGWFSTITVLALNSILMPGNYEPAASPLIPFVIAAGLLTWIIRGTRRAA